MFSSTHSFDSVWNFLDIFCSRGWCKTKFVGGIEGKKNMLQALIFASVLLLWEKQKHYIIITVCVICVCNMFIV